MFNRLRIYTVHLKPDEAVTIDRLRFVPESFQFYAFIFTIFWAIYHRMWRFTGVILVLNAIIAGFAFSIGGLESQIVTTILQMGVQLWCGFSANDFMRAHLKRQGFITYALVSGENVMRAEQRFFDHNHQFLTS